MNRKSRRAKVLHHANDALEMNLPERALKILRGSDVAEFGEEGMRMQIDLALHMGLVRDVHTWFDLDEEQEKIFITKLTRQHYYRFKALLAAATGEYAAADQYLGKLEEELEAKIRSFTQKQILSAAGTVSKMQDENPDPALAVKDAIAVYLSSIILHGRMGLGGAAQAGQLGLGIERLYGLRGAMSERAQYTTLRGMLALEAGDLETAERLFREALKLWKPKPDDPSVVGINFPYRRMAEEWLEILEKYKK